MLFSIVTTGCGFLLAGVLAIPTLNSKRHVVHERREQLPTNWARSNELRGDTFLPVRIALTQNNLDNAEQYLMDVSHPDSPNYGKHWTAQEVADVFAPSDITIRSVIRWLEDAGITSDRVTESKGRNWLNARLTVHEAERLLKTKYYEYKHAETGQIHVACEDYSIPEDVRAYVDFITPTVHFDKRIATPKKRREVASHEIHTNKRSTSSIGNKVEPGIAHSIGAPFAGSLPKQHDIALPLNTLNELDNCRASINPACLRALYRFPDMEDFVLNPANSFGIVEYTPQVYLATDLDMFFGNYSPALVGQRPDLVSIDGGYIQEDTKHLGVNAESNLDLGYGMALVYPQTVTLYQTGDAVEGASFNNFLDALDGSYCTFDGGDDPTQDGIYPNHAPGGYNGSEACGGVAAAYVISSSYGYNEADLTPLYEMRQCNEYLKLGLQGSTFLFSSGDSGVAGNGGQCINMTSNSYNSGISGMFNPGFPSTCPYITSVGATQIQANASVTQPEVAAESIIHSGGGFSNVFDTPSYQAAALATYFAEHKPSYGSDRYNTTQKSRGYPDVSANGVNYAVAVNGEFTHLYGTSASSPTFGAILTLINSARLEAKKGPVGFVNPALYAKPGVLNDITSGGNQGCGTPGFEAVEGWDPVTGLGTPDFPRMLTYFLDLP